MASRLPDLEPDSIRFLHGSWIHPDSIFAFQISATNLDVVDPGKANGVPVEMSLGSCPEIADGFDNLKAAMADSAKIASGELPAAETNEIVMDGPDYRLEYWSRAAATTLKLEGNSNSQLKSPWVDAAYRVRAIADHCRETP